jgi:DNA replication protein DnaC
MPTVTARKLQVSDKPVRDKDNARTKDRVLEEVPPALWRLLIELCDGQHKWPLYLYGPPGAGKSCAALCLVDRIPGAKFFHMPALDEQVRAIKQGTAEWYETGRGGTWTMKGWWNYIANLPLLVLDDVGLPEVSSDTQAETLFMALEAREGKPLICTSNINENDIETTYNSRVQSRMCSGTIYNLMGRDRRFDRPKPAEGG